MTRTNPRSSDADVLATQHALLMTDLDAAHVPAVLALATQPDEPLEAVLDNAQVDPGTWGKLPRTYVRTAHDEVLPTATKDRVIAEADQLTPDNRFDVHTDRRATSRRSPTLPRSPRFSSMRVRPGRASLPSAHDGRLELISLPRLRQRRHPRRRSGSRAGFASRRGVLLVGHGLVGHGL